MAKGKKSKADKQAKQPVKPSTKPEAPALTPGSPPSKLVGELIDRLRLRKLRASCVPSPPAHSLKRKRPDSPQGVEVRSLSQEPWVGDKLLNSLRPLVARLRRGASPLVSTERQPHRHVLAAVAVTNNDRPPVKLLNPTANDFGFGKDSAPAESTGSHLPESDLVHLAAALRSHRVALFEEVKVHHHAQLWRTQKRCQAPEPDIPDHLRGSASDNLDCEVLAQRGAADTSSQPARGIHNVFRAHTQAHKTIFRELRHGKMTLPELENAVAISEARVREENGLPPTLSAVDAPIKAEPLRQEHGTANPSVIAVKSTAQGGAVMLPAEHTASGQSELSSRQVAGSGHNITQSVSATNLNAIPLPDSSNSVNDSNPRKARRRRRKKAERKETQEHQRNGQHGQPQPHIAAARNIEQHPRTDPSVDQRPREPGINSVGQQAIASQGPTSDQAQQQAPERQDRPLSLVDCKSSTRKGKREAAPTGQDHPDDSAVVDLTEDARSKAGVQDKRASLHVEKTPATSHQTHTKNSVYRQGVAGHGGSATGSQLYTSNTFASAGAPPPTQSGFPDVAALSLGRHSQAQYSSRSRAQDPGCCQEYGQSNYGASGSSVPYPAWSQYTQYGRLPAALGHYNPAFGTPNAMQYAPLWNPIVPESPPQHRYHTRSVAKAKSGTPSGSERSTPRRSMSPNSRSVNPPREPFPTAAYRLQALRPPKKASTPQPLLIISDLNGTLILRKPKSKTTFAERPALSGFLAHLFARGTANLDWRHQDQARPPAHKFMIWTSATPETTTSVTALLLTKEEKTNTVAIWARDKLGLNARQYNAKVQVYKKMEVVWSDKTIQETHPAYEQGGRWSQRNTLLIDDSVLKATSQPFNLINVPELTNELMAEEKATTNVPVLGQVAAYVDEASMYEDVSAWMRINPFVVNGKWSEDKAYNFEKYVALVDANDG